MYKKLFLASNSVSRKLLLESMNLDFGILQQNADETVTDSTLSLEDSVRLIASRKMDHIILPQNLKGQIFIITADTLVQDSSGVIHGKPRDRADAINKIKSLRGESFVATAFCVEKTSYINGICNSKSRIISSIIATCNFEIPDSWIDLYISQVDVTSLAGSIAIEGYGMQFLKSISGSYSGVMGLPLFELRTALEDLGYFS